MKWNTKLIVKNPVTKNLIRKGNLKREEREKTFKFSEHYFEQDSVSVCVRFNWLSSEQMTLVSLKKEKETIIKRVWLLEQVTFLLSKLTLGEVSFDQHPYRHFGCLIIVTLKCCFPLFKVNTPAIDPNFVLNIKITWKHLMWNMIILWFVCFMSSKSF